MFIKVSKLFYLLDIFVVLLLKNAASTIGQTEPREEEYTGKLAKPGQFPYAIRLYTRLMDYTVTYCTAAIITHSKLLTAGHCCHMKGYRFVVAGEPDQTDFVTARSRSKYSVYGVRKTIIHPKFEISNNKLVYDLCLLILEKPMSQSDGHKTIEIVYEEFKEQKNCTALGWGSNFGYEIQHKLYYKEALGYKCTLNFDNTLYRFVCLEPHSVCPGDSGGPLVCNGKVHGIASFFVGHGDESDPKCEEGIIDYYTTLSSEREFIEKNSCVRVSPQIYNIMIYRVLYYNIMFLLFFNTLI